MDENLLLTEDFPPAGRVELDLSRHRLLQFLLPDGVNADHVEVSIGLRGPPRPDITHLVFDASIFGFQDLPLILQGVEFRAFVDGQPQTSIEGAADRDHGYFVRCEELLEISLPCNSSYVDVTRGAPGEHRIVAYNEDGSVAEVRESDSLKFGQNRLKGEAIRRVVLEAPGAQLYGISFWCEPEPETTEIEVSAFFERESDRQNVASATARGMAGEVSTVVLEASAIDEIWIGGGPAALVDICYRSDGPDGRSTTQPSAWERVPGFDTPLTLPITHPEYPASPGSESLSAWRAQAAERIRYGNAEDYLATSLGHVSLGTDLRLEPGSALVTVTGAHWDESLVGQLLYPGSLDTAFAVMTVLDPGRLVLSRPFTGRAPLEVDSYERSEEDTFAEIHDQLAALLSAPDGTMRHVSMPPAFDRSDAGTNKRVRLENGRELVVGENTDWSEKLVGLLIELGDNPDVYRIAEVQGKRRLRLDRPFVGDADVGEYRINSRSPRNDPGADQPSLDLVPMDLLELAALEPAYAQLLGLYWIDTEAAEGEVYDYIVLADHGGALGGNVDAALRWLHAHPDVSDEDVDGALIADILHSGSPALAAPRDLRGFALPAGRQRLDLERPDLADSEPGLSVGELAEWAGRPLAERPVMLQPWRRELGPQEPDRTTVPAPGSYQPLGEGPRGDRFLVSASPGDAPVQRPEGWPDPRSIHYLDPGLDVGWYAYRLHAIDLFGRYSALSEPIPWYGVAPVAERHPYAVHLQDLTPPPPPTDVVAWVLDKGDPGVAEDDAYSAWREDHPDVLGLRVRWRWPWTHMLQAPDLEEFRVYYQPSPINARPSEIVSVQPAVGDTTLSEVVLAFGDPDHPADAYHGAALQSDGRSFDVVRSRPSAQLELVVRNGGPGRDVRPGVGSEAVLVLPQGHTLHRDVLDPLNWQARLAHVHRRRPKNATVDRRQVQMVKDESVVTVDAEQNRFRGKDARWNGSRIAIHDLPAGHDLADVRPGIDVIALSSSRGLGGVLEIAALDAELLRIKPVDAPLNLAKGRYSWSIGPPEQLLEGAASSWGAASRTLTLDGARDLSHVRPGLDLIYVKVDPASTPARLGDYFGIERAGDGNDRLVLADDGPGELARLQDGQSYAWKVGWPLHTYEIFLSAEEPADPAAFTVANALATSLAEAVVYGTVGVSAVDRRIEVPDRRTFAEEKRPGNESHLGGPATVFRVHREEPDAPADIDWGNRRLIATKAEYHGKSYFTVRWMKPADPEKRKHYKAHVFRAMDQTLYLVDLEHKTASPGLPDLTEAFPSHWPEPRKAAVTTELGAKYAGLATTDDYDELSDDTLSVLANLERNEEAFSQITIEPLAHTDPNNNDRLGPDDDESTFPGPNPDLAAFLDSMDGRSSNRYFYRLAFVDPGQNLGPLGKSTPPVYLPKVVPPRAPVITGIAAGDRQITLRWASNRERDLKAYTLHRTERRNRGHDIRLMDILATIEPVESDPEDRPAEVKFADQVPGLRTFFYSVVATDHSGNKSSQSQLMAARAFDEDAPQAPIPSAEWKDVGGGLFRAHVEWSSNFETIIQRREEGGGNWAGLGKWHPAGSQSITDMSSSSSRRTEYRIIARKYTGAIGTGGIFVLEAIS